MTVHVNALWVSHCLLVSLSPSLSLIFSLFSYPVPKLQLIQSMRPNCPSLLLKPSTCWFCSFPLPGGLRV